MIRPPARNEILPGARLEKSFAGETTFAAMFIAQRGDDRRELGDAPRASRDAKRRAEVDRVPDRLTEDHARCALVMKTPMAANTVIVVGSATTCPTVCSRCERP